MTTVIKRETNVVRVTAIIVLGIVSVMGIIGYSFGKGGLITLAGVLGFVVLIWILGILNP